MINRIIRLADLLDRYGLHREADRLDKLAKAITLCVASFNNSVTLENGHKVSIFKHKAETPEQMMGAIAAILSRHNNRVWFLGDKYELPTETRLLTRKFLEEHSVGRIVCECYVEEKKENHADDSIKEPDIEGFMKEFKERTVDTGYDFFGRFHESGCSMIVEPYSKNGVVIEWIQALGKPDPETRELKSIERGTGAGTEAMKFIEELADKYNVEVYLSVGSNKIRTSPKSRLHRFYKRHGFVGKDFMTRKPNKTENDNSADDKSGGKGGGG